MIYTKSLVPKENPMLKKLSQAWENQNFLKNIAMF